ncbi:hypothetical protein EJ05DRAFT_479044 [Pseudovirgaria hyperparasitica]|uniref:Uncharacterized protein n=1 Tax=Pseudovirgaria hyperparasitica TaxID=470096 RepID=A0A6A6VXC0_9PEZI|nr:uncharacterized protein EJ05DRAFT_479044 [Pseudovirgaria hyperparasitica]KAF2755252.1 hypothetical protein EJ05DRAFT_479044 [Pseudovirgaria hyperparasitica]
MALPRALVFSLLVLGATANAKRHINIKGREVEPVPVPVEAKREPAPLAREELSYNAAGELGKRQYCYSTQFLCGAYCCDEYYYNSCALYDGLYSSYTSCTSTYAYDYSSYYNSYYSDYSSYSDYTYHSGGGSSSKKGSKFPAKAIAGVVIGVIALLASIIGGVFALLKKRRAAKNAGAPTPNFDGAAAAPAYAATAEKGPTYTTNDVSSPMAPPVYGTPAAGTVYQPPQSPPPVHQQGYGQSPMAQQPYQPPSPLNQQPYQPPQSPPVGQQPYQPPQSPPIGQQAYQPQQSPQMNQGYYPAPVEAPTPQQNAGQTYYPPPVTSELGPGR